MISITLLSLTPEALQRMTSYTAADDTIRPPWERALGAGFILSVAIAGAAIALVFT
jgi:hypothetical protein